MKLPSSWRSIVISMMTLISASADDTDRAALLDGVREINTGGVSGGLCIFGPQAFAVVSGTEGKGTMLPVVAASRMEKGRIVAFGHDGFLSSVNQKDTGRLLRNSIRWAAGKNPEPRVGLLAIYNTPKVLEYLKSNGIHAMELSAREDGISLDGIDVMCVNAISLDNAHAVLLEKWVREGGGMLTGVTGWGWIQLRGGNDRAKLASDCAANHLLANSGVVFSASTPGRTATESYLTNGDSRWLNASTALDAILDHTSGKTLLPPDQLKQCGTSVGDAIRSLPPEDTILRSRLNDLPHEANASPSPSNPFPADAVLKRLIFARDSDAVRNTKPEAIKAHEASYFFPGITPPEALRIPTRTVSLKLAVPQWHGTGLYAPAGEVIQISIPPQYAGKGIAVRIGCHTDTLWHLDTWKRAPEISLQRNLKEPVTSVASPFGGLIYIEIPQGGPPVNMDVAVSGAIEAPRFVLGETSVTDWQNRMRDLPSPWGELETEKIILSMPRWMLQKVDDPEALLQFWDRVLDAQADLSTIPRDRTRPERIVPDIQISGGYMHSGYPIMTHLDGSAETAASLERLSKGSWGHFHELGHNHQQPDWTFDGTVEVTCNLYTLYVTEMLCGNPAGRGHEQMLPLVIAAKLRKHLTQPDKFTRWKKDPFLALIMYDQLREGFGWDTYKKVFAEYRALPKDQRPKNDDEKRDQWLVRFSKAAGRNLGPFFEEWGVPTSRAARDSIADLPSWRPGNPK